MAIDDLASMSDDKSSSRQRHRLIGVHIGVLAVILAICAMGGTTQPRKRRSKISRQLTSGHSSRPKTYAGSSFAHTEDLELLLDTTPSLTPERRARISEKIAANKAYDAKLTSDKEGTEGLNELFHRGKALEVERDRAMAQDPYFDYAQACLQIAIVLASIAIISGGTSLLALSGLLGASGALLTLNGFAMLVEVPGLS